MTKMKLFFFLLCILASAEAFPLRLPHRGLRYKADKCERLVNTRTVDSMTQPKRDNEQSEITQNNLLKKPPNVATQEAKEDSDVEYPESDYLNPETSPAPYMIISGTLKDDYPDDDSDPDAEIPMTKNFWSASTQSSIDSLDSDPGSENTDYDLERDGNVEYDDSNSVPDGFPIENPYSKVEDDATVGILGKDSPQHEMNSDRLITSASVSWTKLPSTETKEKQTSFVASVSTSSPTDDMEDMNEGDSAIDPPDSPNVEIDTPYKSEVKYNGDEVLSATGASGEDWNQSDVDFNEPIAGADLTVQGSREDINEQASTSTTTGSIKDKRNGPNQPDLSLKKALPGSNYDDERAMIKPASSRPRGYPYFKLRNSNSGHIVTQEEKTDGFLPTKSGLKSYDKKIPRKKSQNLATKAKPVPMSVLPQSTPAIDEEKKANKHGKISIKKSKILESKSENKKIVSAKKLLTNPKPVISENKTAYQDNVTFTEKQNDDGEQAVKNENNVNPTEVGGDFVAEEGGIEEEDDQSIDDQMSDQLKIDETNVEFDNVADTMNDKLIQSLELPNLRDRLVDSGATREVRVADDNVEENVPIDYAEENAPMDYVEKDEQIVDAIGRHINSKRNIQSELTKKGHSAEQKTKDPKTSERQDVNIKIHLDERGSKSSPLSSNAAETKSLKAKRKRKGHRKDMLKT